MYGGIARSIVFVLLASSVQIAEGRGRMMEPPQRSSLWRFSEWRGKPMVATNTEDNGLNCGGYWKLHEINMHQCGVCGDPYDDKKRPNEAGGRYGLGIIVRTYKQSDLFINITIDITANIGGYFEFRICPNNDIKRTVQQSCLDKYPLIINGHGIRYYPNGDGLINLKVKIPEDMTCDQCVVQWKWKGSYYWGVCGDGYGGIGCGDQEEYYNCADIAILPSKLGNNGAPTTPLEPTEEYWPENVTPEVTQSTTSASMIATENTVPTPDWLWRLLSVIDNQKEKTTRSSFPSTASPGTTRFPPPPTIAPKWPYFREVEVKTPSISKIGTTTKIPQLQPYWSTLEPLSSTSLGSSVFTTVTSLSETQMTTNKTLQIDDVTSKGSFTTVTKGPVTTSTGKVHSSKTSSTKNTSKPTSDVQYDLNTLSNATITFNSTTVASKMTRSPVNITSSEGSNITPVISTPHGQDITKAETRINSTSYQMTNKSNDSNTTIDIRVQSVRQNSSGIQADDAELLISGQNDATRELNTSVVYLNVTYVKFNETFVSSDDYIRINETQSIMYPAGKLENDSIAPTRNTNLTKNVTMIDGHVSHGNANETLDQGTWSIKNTTLSNAAITIENTTSTITDHHGNVTGKVIYPVMYLNQSVPTSATNQSAEQNVTTRISLSTDSDIRSGNVSTETTMPPIVPAEEWNSWANDDNKFQKVSTIDPYSQENTSATTSKTVDIKTTAIPSHTSANNSKIIIVSLSTPIYRGSAAPSADLLNDTSSSEFWNVSTVSEIMSGNDSLNTTISSVVNEIRFGKMTTTDNSASSATVTNTTSTTDSTREVTTTLSPIDELALRGPLLIDDDTFGLSELLQPDVDLQIDSPLGDSTFVAMADSIFPVFETTTAVQDNFVFEATDNTKMMSIKNLTFDTGSRLSTTTTKELVAGKVKDTQMPRQSNLSVDLSMNRVKISTTVQPILPVAEALISHANPKNNVILQNEPFVELGQSQGAGIPVLLQENPVQSSTTKPTVYATSPKTTTVNSGVTEPRQSPKGVLLTNGQSIVSGLDIVETNLKVGGNRNLQRSSGFDIGGNLGHQMEGDSVIVTNFIDNSVLRSDGFGDNSEKINKKDNQNEQTSVAANKDIHTSVATSKSAVKPESTRGKNTIDITKERKKKDSNMHSNTIVTAKVPENRHINIAHADKNLPSGADVHTLAISNVDQAVNTFENSRAGQKGQSAGSVQQGKDGLSHFGDVTDISASLLMDVPPSVPSTLNVDPGSILDALLGDPSIVTVESPSVGNIQNNVLPGETVPMTNDKEAEQPTTDRTVRWLH